MNGVVSHWYGGNKVGMLTQGVVKLMLIKITILQ